MQKILSLFVPILIFFGTFTGLYAQRENVPQRNIKAVRTIESNQVITSYAEVTVNADTKEKLKYLQKYGTNEESITGYYKILIPVSELNVLKDKNIEYKKNILEDENPKESYKPNVDITNVSSTVYPGSGYLSQWGNEYVRGNSENCSSSNEYPYGVKIYDLVGFAWATWSFNLPYQEAKYYTYVDVGFYGKDNGIWPADGPEMIVYNWSTYNWDVIRGSVGTTEDFYIEALPSYQIGTYISNNNHNLLFRLKCGGVESVHIKYVDTEFEYWSDPILSITPTSRNYGNIDVNYCSSTYPYILKNIGTGTATGSVSLTGTNSNQFQITSGGGYFSLAAGQQKTIRVKFCPTTEGSKTATLLADGDNCSDISSSLSGTGIGYPTLVIDPQFHSYGDINVNDCSSTYSFLLSNRESGTATGSVSLIGWNPDQFQITSGGGSFSLPANETKSIVVKFCPTTGGSKTATLLADGTNCPDIVASLTGTGICIPHFTLIWTGPYLPMNIYVTSAELNGIDLSECDEIGVFDGDNCVGFVSLNEVIPSDDYVQIIASTDDPTTTEVDGFIAGHTITYKFWDSNNSREITSVIPTYSLGDGTFSSLGSASVDLICEKTCEGDIYLRSQADVDNFGANGCNVVTGDLWIVGKDITNLNALSSMRRVGNRLVIGGPYGVLSELTNIDGLSGITSVGGGLYISRNSVLTNVDGLSNITSVGGKLGIFLNDLLDNIDGLSSLTSIGRGIYISHNGSLSNINGLSTITPDIDTLDISYNSALINVDGLSGLTSIEGQITIKFNDLLANINGFSGITSVGGKIQINHNPLLTNVDGLSNLTSVSSISITSCESLTNVNGLLGVTSVEGSMNISNNNVLENIDGLSNLTSTGEDLTIYRNSIITNIDALSNITSVGGSLIIFDNGELNNINSLSSLSTVGKALLIRDNTALIDVNGLSGLTSIGWNLYIQSNNTLNNIDGLSSLITIGEYEGLSIKIEDNLNLSRCCGIYPILTYGTIPGQIDIINNGNGCTEEGILSDGSCTIVDIQGVIDEVEVLITEGTLTGGQGNSLITKLEGAIKKLRRDEYTAAINKLNAFINQVNSFITEGILAETEGQELISAVNDIIEQINNESELPEQNDENVTEEITELKPDDYSLSQNYPNPFNPITTIVYGLPEDASVVISVYNVLGTEIMQFNEGRKSAGYHKVSFNASNLPSGIYFYTLQAGSIAETKKMILMK